MYILPFLCKIQEEDYIMRNNVDKNSLIKYKWEMGAYDIDDMLALVKWNQITPEEFFDITRKHYQSMVESNKK
jgi:hypothetical protein